MTLISVDSCSLGQTGSGKTYTMMGDPEEQGVIPRFCSELFTQLAHARANSQLMIQSTDLDSDIAAPCLMESKVEVSYYEIYNERIYDLLSSTPEIASKVREHPTDGAFVEGLTLRSVTNYDEIAVILEEGHSKRQVAETLMNATSSRSHAVFTLYLTQKIFIPRPKSLQKSTKISEVMHRKSKVNLIDLAGSERLNSTGASGDRLKEATNINRSLFVLGEVIKTLAENSEKGGDGFVPYRNSLLTWILKDSLGGNSKTTMLATVSPIGPSYAESTNTLRYIERAKLIASKARINDDNANDPYIKHLQQQVALYKGKLSTALNQLHEKEVESEKKCQQFIEEIESLQSQLKEANRLSRRLSRAMSNEDKVRNEENAGAGADSVGSPLIKAPSLRSLESASSSGHLAIKLDEEEEDVSHLQIDMLAADSCHSSTDGDGDPTLAIKLDSTDDGLTPSKPYRVPTIRNLATEVRQLQEALALSMQECEEARQRLIDTEDSFRLEVEYLQERVQVGEVELSSLRESLKSVDSLENQTSIDHVTICQLEENIAGLNSIIETLQLRVTHKDNEIQELKESNRIALSELRRTMDHAVKDLQHQCDTKTLLLGDQSNQIASLHAKLQTFDESFTLQSQEHRALTSRYEQAILDLKELLEQTDLHYRDSLAVLEENLASARSDNERLQQALLRKDHEMEANEQKHSLELDDLCNEIEGMKHLINQRIEQYEAKLDQKNEEIDRLQLQLSAIVPVDSGNELAIAELNSLLELRNQTIEGLSRQSTLKDETISDLRAQLLAATNRIQEFEQKKSESPTLRSTSVRKSSFDRSESANLSSGSEITKRPLPRRSLSSAANYEKLIIQRLKSQLQEREEELQNIKLEHEKDILEFCDEVVKLKSLVDTKVTDFGQMKARHEEIIVHSQLEVEVLKKELNDVQHLHEVRLLEVLSDIETLQEDIRVRVGSISSERTARDEEAKNELPIASESGISAAVTSPTSATSTLSVSTRIRDRIETFPTSSTASSPRNSLDCDSIGGGGVTSPSGSVIKLETEVMKELKLLRCRFEEQEKTHEAVRSELQNQLQASQEEQQRSLRRIEELEKEKRAGDEEMRRKVEDYEKRIHDIESERNLMKAQLQSRIQLTDDPREVHGGNGGGAKQGKKGGGFFFCGR